METYMPEYYSRFRCLVGDCPDSCCYGWTVDLDEETAERYRALPGPLGERLRQCMKQEPWGTVLALAPDGRCPMWREDGLCRIQAQLGEGALSHVCKTFPRLCHDYGGFQELGLELSCPEAARLILECDSFYPTAETLHPGQGGDYDEAVMQTLLRTRRELMAFIDGKTLPIRETLAVTLLYGYRVQEGLDFGEGVELDAADALAAARDCAWEGDSRGVLDFFRQGLEILSPAWGQRLEGTVSREIPEAVRPLLRYFLGRYYLQAVSDRDIVCRVKLAVVSCLVIALLGGELRQTAQQYSKEIENDPDNVEALLEAAYTHPGFCDANLLGLMLK